MPGTRDFLICLDSDGCVFDTMEIKQKECFCPAFIKHMNLQAASKYAREVWEFVNLYSKTRGCNRFLAVKRALELMRNRHEIRERNVDIPELPSLMNWLREETKLGNPALRARVDESGDPELRRLLDWSLEVNERIADMVHGISPFPGVLQVLEKGRNQADLMVVSQTPLEALTREWKENAIDNYALLIAGQEHGAKSEHIKYAAEGKGYGENRILMVGDAPGDLKAARANSALFFPVLPGAEEKSWAELTEVGIDRFFNEEYAGDYQKKVLREFEAALPEKPHWN